MWVARDECGELKIFKLKPYRDWIGMNGKIDGFWTEEPEHNGMKCVYPEDYFDIDSSLFPDLTWEDEPIEVGLHEITPKHKITCKHCGKTFSYDYNDVRTCFDESPWASGYTDEIEYLICPYCGKTNDL